MTEHLNRICISCMRMANKYNERALINLNSIDELEKTVNI